MDIKDIESVLYDFDELNDVDDAYLMILDGALMKNESIISRTEEKIKYKGHHIMIGNLKRQSLDNDYIEDLMTSENSIRLIAPNDAIIDNLKRQFR